MRQGTHETDQKEVDQADAQDRADLFRVHVLRRRGLKISGNSKDFRTR